MYNRTAFILSAYENTDYLLQIVVQVFVRTPKLVEFFHGYNLPVVVHSCGYQKPMLPMEAKAGNNIVEYARAYGEDFVYSLEVYREEMLR